jgi:hypothetical protein
VIPSQLYAQYEREGDASIPLDYFYIKRDGPGIIRRVLSKLTFSVSTGYGRTFYHNELDDSFGILQNPDSLPKLYLINSPTIGYSNWFNRVEPSTNTFQPGSIQADHTMGKLGFKTQAFNIPIRATVHTQIDRYRIGLGYSYEYTRLGDFKPIDLEADIQAFTPEVQNHFISKYFLILGGEVYRYYEYLLAVDLNVGGYGLGKKFDENQLSKGVFVNVGTSIEREMSEYFRVFVRPSFEFKKYELNVPESQLSIQHRFNAFYVNIGVSYRFPELRRCFIKNCHAQMHHAHGNKEYRSRVHPFYKKQNPHYGENHPTLIKYKGKNKRKLTPY